ncbi:GDSL-type esterase/lipase family protein [Enterococcus sp. AD013-P3]|uniref:GDSL-type esterase/lipase family protein n=1 Tax=Enterococcus sp. AD013-P3 TaxID=3411036 RepID=UPI003B9459E5
MHKPVQEEWTDFWSGCQQDYRSWPSKIWQDQQLITLKLSVDTEQIRIRFSNRFGVEPIHFQSVLLSVLLPSTGEVAKVPVLIDGKVEIKICPGYQLISDPVEIKIAADTVIRIETKLAEPVALTSGLVMYSRQIAKVSNISKEKEVSQKHLFRMVAENPKMQFIYGVAGIDLPQKIVKKKVVFFGDSLVQQGFITDGLQLRIPKDDYLNIALVNRGIGGSRILTASDPNIDPYERHGRSGLERFETDTFSTGAVDSVIVLHGINDILTAYNDSGKEHFSLENVIFGLKQYVKLAHSHGAACQLCTLMPFGRSIFYSDKLETLRQSVNEWIRTAKFADGYFDLDLAVAQAGNPQNLDLRFDSGDGIHLNMSGGQKVAAAIDIDKLQQ